MTFNSMRLGVLVAVASVVGSAQTDKRIVPLYAVAPAVFQTGLTSGAVFTVLEANPNSDQRLLDGDRFVFGLNGAGMSIVSTGLVTVNGTGFTPGNFTILLSPDGRQIIVTYRGSPAAFLLGDSFSVSANLLLTQVTSGFVTLQTPDERFQTPQSFAASVSGVSFELPPASFDRSSHGPIGPAGQLEPPDRKGRLAHRGLRDHRDLGVHRDYRVHKALLGCRVRMDRLGRPDLPVRVARRDWYFGEAGLSRQPTPLGML